MCIFQSVIEDMERRMFLHSVSDEKDYLFPEIIIGVIISTPRWANK